MKEVLAFLFPYLVLLYLFDCVVRVRSGHLIFVSIFGRRFRLGGEGVHAACLMPTGQAVLSHNLPLFLSGEGVHLPAAESRWDRPVRARDIRFVPWSEIVSAAASGADVLINGTISVALPSEAAAAQAASAIRILAQAAPAARSGKAEALLAGSYDLRALEGLRERVRTPLLGVAILSSLLFLCVYVVLPLGLFARPFQGRSIAPLLLGMALAYALAVAAAFAARKAIAPADSSGRARLVLLLVLLPPGAAHVLGPVTRDLFAGFDHLTIAAALLDRDAFRRLARREIARFAFAEVPPGDRALADALRMKERSARGLLAQAGLDAERILDPPRRESPAAERYCPACEVEYLEGAVRCADCGIPLADFAGADERRPGDAAQESACAKSSPG